VPKTLFALSFLVDGAVRSGEPGMSLICEERAAFVAKNVASLAPLGLVVAGRMNRWQRPIETLRRIRDKPLDGQADLEVIDICQPPELAGEYPVIAVPTLIRLLPLPIRRVIGDLWEKERVLRGLEIAMTPQDEHEKT
jgi:circadian clock protein KaiB